MRYFQTTLLFLSLFLCSNLTAQIESKNPKVKLEKKKVVKRGVKAKIIFDENGKQIGPAPIRSIPKEGAKQVQQPITVQDANTKFASATKIKKKATSRPKQTPVNIDHQIKSLEERITQIQNSSISNKEAELDKLKTALARKKTQKAKNN